MNVSKKIKSALISVYYKDLLDDVVKQLDSLGVKIYSTGGTQEFIEKLGISVTSVESLTSYPSILGGRVKTLHPKVFGGILARRGNESDQSHLSQYEIPEIDLVIVDLYPFEETVASGAEDQDIIEKIDIGGISLIRAAAKNYNDVVIVASRDQYKTLLSKIQENGGEFTLDERRRFACEAFNYTSHYDTAIFQYFNRSQKLDSFKQSFREGKTLRYGENPHQKGLFYGEFSDLIEQLHGKEISYNNLLDIDAAISLIAEFKETTFAVLKHNNACGLASRNKLIDAWTDALAGDPVSAFGGVLITNRKLDVDTAREIDKLFFEVMIAPSYDEEALQILKNKKNRIILLQKETKLPGLQFRSLLNGVIAQDKDLKSESPAEMTPTTVRIPTEVEMQDMVFANIIVKHTKSNAIVLAKNRQLIASGVGQTSRVDALKQAIQKAENFNFELNGAVMASDAYFPFADCAEIAHQSGINIIIQPGGSIRDKDTIDYCNNNNMAMVFTGIRHFKH